MKNGSIPETIRVFARPPIEIKFKWDDIDVSDDVAANICQPIFVTDSTNAKTQETAKSWASQSRWSWDPVTGARVKADDSYTEFERLNLPMVGLRIIGLVIRGQGGRAYQVLVSGKYVFDLREDVLLDAMLNDGIGKNGALFGSYIFASVGSSMKLIRVGSLLHEKMIEATGYNTMKKITNLEVGGIYRNKKSTVLYLGHVYTRHFATHYTEDSYDRWSTLFRAEKRKLLGVSLGKEVKTLLTIDLCRRDNNVPKTLEDVTKGISQYHFNWIQTKPTSFREKVGQIEGDLQTILETLRDAAKIDTASTNMDEYESSSYILNMSAVPGYVHPRLKELTQA